MPALLASVLSVFFLSEHLKAESSEAPHGLCRHEGLQRQIEKLACDSSTSLIEASNPGLKIANCGIQAKALVQPETLPTSSVFVSCAPHQMRSCTNIARAILQAKTGATTNVLVNGKVVDDPEVGKALRDLRKHADQSKAMLNIIPVETNPHTFMRDPAVISTANDERVYTVNPYSHQNTGLGDPLTSEIARKCGYKFESSYAKLAEFDSAYLTIGQTNAECTYGIHGNIRVACEKSPGTNAANSGGNFVAAPDGTLLVGKNDKQKPDQGILDYFGKTQTVKVVPIPNLHIGHLDEVIRFVPSQNPCGFEILAASPREMVHFLNTRKPSDTVYSEFNQVKTVESVLNDRELLTKWDEYEQVIQSSLEDITKSLRFSNPKCTPHITSLPVYWDLKGKPALPNPVNGLTINGRYFFSRSSNKDYQSFLIKKLSPLFKKRVVTVDTTEYDRGNGNFHCATLNVLMPCK